MSLWFIRAPASTRLPHWSLLQGVCLVCHFGLSECQRAYDCFCCQVCLVCRFGLSERQRAHDFHIRLLLQGAPRLSLWSIRAPASALLLRTNLCLAKLFVRCHGKLSSVKFWSDPNMVLDHHTLAMLVRICAHFESNQLALFQPILTIHHPCQKFIPNLRAIRLFKPWRFPPFCLPWALL